MRDANIINAAQASEAQAYPLQLATRVEAGEVAPYFVEWIRQQLDEKFGTQLYEQGLKVYTTLDLDLQTAAERSMERQIRAIEAGRFGTFPHITYERYIARAERRRPEQRRQLAVPAGRVHRDGSAHRRRSRARRRSRLRRQQVRSRGAGGAAARLDVQADRLRRRRAERTPAVVHRSTTRRSPCSCRAAATWTPQNFEGDYAGKIPMRRALYQSRNVPTIKLGIELGMQSVIDEARKFGLTTPIPGVSVDLHRRGRRLPDRDGRRVHARSPRSARARSRWRSRASRIRRATCCGSRSRRRVPVLSPEEAWLMVSVMKDVVQRGTAAGSVGSQFHYPAGGKTGTTNDGTDVWFIGYTSDLVAGVWMGFDKPQKIKANAQGGILAAPAWTAFMNEVYRAQARAARLADARRHRHAPDRRHDEHARDAVLSDAPSSATSSSFRERIRCCSATSTTARRCIPDTSGIGGARSASIPRVAFATVRSLRFRPAIPRRKSPRRDTIRPPKIPPDTTAASSWRCRPERERRRQTKDPLSCHDSFCRGCTAILEYADRFARVFALRLPLASRMTACDPIPRTLGRSDLLAADRRRRRGGRRRANHLRRRHRTTRPPGTDVDLGDVLLMPGLVNAHCASRAHRDARLPRGSRLSALDSSSHQRSPRRARSRRAARFGALRIWRREFAPESRRYADTCESGVVMQAMREAGVRGVMYQEVFGPDPAQCAESIAGLREKVAGLRYLETPLVRVGISPHAPYTVSDDLFRAAAALARELAVADGGSYRRERARARAHRRREPDRLPTDCDVAESPSRHAPRRRSSSSPTLGVLDVAPLLIHCVRVDAHDIANDRRQSRSPVAHCPASNAKLGHGIAPLDEMLAAGITVGLGSDSMASNNRMDMLEEARLALLAQRARIGSWETPEAVDVLELATIGGARALGAR